jgi:renierapurpurin 18,18'-hydroxylase
MSVHSQQASFPGTSRTTRAVRSGSQPAHQTDLRRTGIHPDFWYPVARSKDVPPGQLRQVSFAGDPIVIARTKSGSTFALEDRCAHRQMPLHLGVVQGEQVKCSYHAWCYHGNGKLAQVPYLPKGQRVPRGIRNYPCREAYGLIFVFPGRPDQADHVPFPSIPTWSSPHYRTMYFAREVRCHYSFMHENLMDMNHQFLHRRLMGSIQPTLLDLRRDEHAIEVDYRFEQAGGKPHFGAGLMMGKKDTEPDRRHFDIMTIRTVYPYQTLTLRRPTSPDPALHLWTAYVPVDRAQRRNRSFGLLMLKKPNIPGLLYLTWPAIRFFTERVFAEDRMAVEAEQRAYDEQGADWNHEVFPAILELRALLTRCGVPL